jgi:hypothetical protein
LHTLLLIFLNFAHGAYLGFLLGLHILTFLKILNCLDHDTFKCMLGEFFIP